MAVTTTTRFGLTRWSAQGDPLTRVQMDDSHAAIESKGAIFLQGAATARPSAGVAGRFYYATDTGNTTYDDGVGWRTVLNTDVVTLTGNQTLTNKALTSPTITGTIALPATTSIGNVSDTEISYLDGVTSSIQAQINTKSPSASPTFTGAVTLPATTSIGTVSSTELGYLNGVGSNIQAQINGKANTAHTHLVADVTGLQTALDARGLLSNGLHQFASTTSAQLAGVISDETGSGALVFANSPTFTGTVTIPTLALTTSVSNSGASHYFVAVSSDGVPRPKTLADVRAEIVTPDAVGAVATATVGTVTSGVWQGTIIAGQYGGTGVANTGKTITVSGNVSIGSSTHTVTFATSGNTSVTLPTSGTLVNDVVSTLNSLVSIDTTNTAAHAVNIASGATISGATKTINIGTGGVSGSNTAIALGSATSNSTITLNGSVAVANTSATSNAASHYYIHTGDNVVRPKTLADVRAEVVTSAAVNAAMGTVDLEFTTTGKGVILKSSNGTRYRITVDDDGSLKSTAL